MKHRTSSHARDKRCLKEQFELFQCYYNFIRPHSALRFGSEVRTPAKQAGLVLRNLCFRDVFSLSLALFLWVLLISLLRNRFLEKLWNLKRGNLILNNT